jgi:hypothetical protein
METTNFKCRSNSEGKASRMVPDQKAIQAALKSAKKKPLEKNAVIIARYQWLKSRNLNLPPEMELPNLCLTVKEGKLIRAIYSEVLVHVIKKQRYHIQILN